MLRLAAAAAPAMPRAALHSSADSLTQSRGPTRANAPGPQALPTRSISGNLGGVSKRPGVVCAAALLGGVLVGCSDNDEHANPNTAATITTASAPTEKFVCFFLNNVPEPTPEEFRAFASLVRTYPPAAGLAVLAGYKRDAAVSVKLNTDQDAAEWIDELPDTLRRHELVRSVEVEDWDCGKVNA
jgi:hypothetical protein